MSSGLFEHFDPIVRRFLPCHRQNWEERIAPVKVDPLKIARHFLEKGIWINQKRRLKAGATFESMIGQHPLAKSVDGEDLSLIEALEREIEFPHAVRWV